MNCNCKNNCYHKKYDIRNCTLFKLSVVENFPFIEADFDALTNYELICLIKESQVNLIDYITKYVKELNNYIEEFENGIIGDFDCFKNCINKTIEDFENTILNRIDTQDRKVTDAIQYMKDNLTETCNILLNQMIERGELKVLLTYTAENESLNLIVTKETNESDEVDNNG